MNSNIKSILVIIGLFIFTSTFAFINYPDGYTWRGFHLPGWTAWADLFCAILLGAFTMREILAGRWRKKMDYTPEELNQTRKVLDQICKTDTAKQQEPGETENKKE